MGDEGASEQAVAEPRVGRRAIVAGGLGGVVASALTRLQAAHAQDDVQPSDPFRLGTDNVASDTTGLSQDGAGPALRIENPGDGLGIEVLSDRSPALTARSGASAGLVGIGGPMPSVGAPLSGTPGLGVTGVGDEVGVFGHVLPRGRSITAFAAAVPNLQAGVAGVAERLGVLGHVLPRAGAISIPFGLDTRVGVWGAGGELPPGTVITEARDAGPAGIGVWGSAPAVPSAEPITYTMPAAGVVGTASGPDQTAVMAHNPAGTALRVEGDIAIDCGGTGVVPRQQSEVEVVDPRIRSSSVVLATLTGDPGNRGTTLHHVEVGEGRFRLVVTARPSRDTPFSYLCFELL